MEEPEYNGYFANFNPKYYAEKKNKGPIVNFTLIFPPALKKIFFFYKISQVQAAFFLKKRRVSIYSKWLY